MEMTGPTPDLRSQKFWECGPANLTRLQVRLMPASVETTMSDLNDSPAVTVGKLPGSGKYTLILQNFLDNLISHTYASR